MAKQARKIIVSKKLDNVIVAIAQGKDLEQLFVDQLNSQDQDPLGNIYKGKVIRILPGLDSAFVDIGLEKAGFIYSGDISPQKLPIKKLLRDGQDLLVQVTKSPTGTKGAMLSTFISIAGRYVVLTPTQKDILFSRKIEDEKFVKVFQERLQKLLGKLNLGFIVRTVASEADDEALKREIDSLHASWLDVQKSFARAKAPALLYGNQNIVQRVLRDFVDKQFTEILINDKKLHQETLDFVKVNFAQHQRKVKFYRSNNNIFDQYKLQDQIAEALQPRVRIEHGSYLIIEKTEAFWSIDVNTGRFVGKNDMQKTILSTNLAAATAIARQIVLRNMAGIIIIDFIDMKAQADKELVQNTLQDALKDDKARANFYPINELGLLHITRRRLSPSLQERMLEICPKCNGTGFKEFHSV